MPSNSNNIQLSALPPLSIYIHIPWCIRKCPYCDFNSHAVKNQLPEDEYVAALIRDLELALPDIWGRPIQSIFIGGGTPSLFSGASIDKLLTQIRARTTLSPYAEITLEANPGTVESAHIKDYANAGVNRISMGIQSFNDRHLQALGRIHNSREAQQAIEKVAHYFDNFNLDIIYGLPEQTIEQAVNDIQIAVAFNPTHISAYNLTIEPNTAFAVTPPEKLPDNDLCYEIQDALMAQLQQFGFQRYEVSAYARTGRQSQHNLNYWQFGDYLGIGAGAHSKISFPDRIIRQMRYKHPEKYLSQIATASPIQEQIQVAAADLPFEFMLNSLRLCAGIPARLFNDRTGLPFSQIIDTLLNAEKEQLISLADNRITPTALGQNFLNDLVEKFLN